MTNTDDPLESFVDNPTEFVHRAVDQRVGRLEQEVAHQRLSANQERVQAALDADPQLRDHWRALNVDPGFIAWLNQPDQYTDTPKLGMLHDACHLGDAQRVKRFFQAYLAEQVPARLRTAERVPFENQSNPRTGTNLTTPGRVWTRQEISAFYEAVAAGLYDEREQEKIRIEHDIVAAARERRVLNPPPQTK